VQVQFDDGYDPSQIPTYFCLIHAGMEGSIKMLQNGEPIESTKVGDSALQEIKSSWGSYVDSRSDFDKECGTYGLGQFQLPNPLCPDHFICGTDGVTDELQHFSACLEAANCAVSTLLVVDTLQRFEKSAPKLKLLTSVFLPAQMMSGMTTGVKATQDSALFIHQMIPHHQNAVNTAKTLLKTGNLLCPDLTDQTNPQCVLEGILREIVAGQNHQIQMMRRFLSDHQYPQEDNCDVYVETVELHDLLDDPEEAKTTSGTSVLAIRWQKTLFAGTCFMGLLMM